ncbi:MAG: Rv2578c family radical SAM protein, partial [Nakamurella sp.]
GITFHEVHAKSVLNKVPGASAMPFGWTVNPYRGCTHACAYCLDPNTWILMANGTTRRLRDVEVGDMVMGTVVRGRYRRYVPSLVHAKWPTRQPAYRVVLADRTELIASGDHRFLTDGGWKHVAGTMVGQQRRPYLTTSDRLLGFGLSARPPEADVDTADYTRKQSLADAAVKSHAHLQVVAVEPLGDDRVLIDISTETADFIANGVVSHNCFARNTHTYLDFDAGKDFDTQIVVKTNAGEVLRRELAKPQWAREHVALGTNTDPYQRAEGRYCLMPAIIDALADSGTPFSILTKGTVLGRDLGQLARAANRVPVGIGISLALLDPTLQATLEPGTPSPKARLALIRRVRDAGLPCGVFLAPLLPHLTDSADQLAELVAELTDAGVTGVSGISLHLRPGTKEWFMQWLSRERPELVPTYLALYRGGSYVPRAYRDAVAERVQVARKAAGMGSFNSAMRGRGESRGVPGDPDASFPDGSLPPPAPPAPAPPAPAFEQLRLI